MRDFSVVKISDLSDNDESSSSIPKQGDFKDTKHGDFCSKTTWLWKKTLDLQHPFCLDNGRWLFLDFQKIATKNGDSASN